MSADSASVLAWREELSALQARLGELFVRAEPRRQAGLYLEGLLSAAKRKNGWQLAEQIGDARPWRTQRVLSHVLCTDRPQSWLLEQNEALRSGWQRLHGHVSESCRSAHVPELACRECLAFGRRSQH